MNHKQQKIIKISYIIYYLILFVAIFYCLKHQMDSVKMGFVASFTCFLVPLVLKILKMKPIFEIYLINIIFALIASIFGSMLNAYSIPFFDKILHFSSGLFITELCYMLFCYLKKDPYIQTKNERILAVLFVNAANMMVAVYWEFFEYACLIFLHNDAINHYTSGVHDSMTDMLVACLGGFFVTYHIIRYFKTDKKNFWVHLNTKFYKLNFSSNNN
ncbi:MAG: hypothetical protein ACI4U3_00275 [Traorella sp.]